MNKMNAPNDIADDALSISYRNGNCAQMHPTSVIQNSARIPPPHHHNGSSAYRGGFCFPTSTPQPDVFPQGVIIPAAVHSAHPPITLVPTQVASQANSSINRSQRCGICRGCQCKPCGVCTYCQDSPQFGGPGVKKQSCIERRCLRVLENRLQRDAPTFKARTGCGNCEDCRTPDCHVCLVCLDKRFFENRYMTGALCHKKRCNNSVSFEVSHSSMSQQLSGIPPGPLTKSHKRPHDNGSGSLNGEVALKRRETLQPLSFLPASESETRAIGDDASISLAPCLNGNCTAKEWTPITALNGLAAENHNKEPGQVDASSLAAVSAPMAFLHNTYAAIPTLQIPSDDVMAQGIQNSLNTNGAINGRGGGVPNLQPLHTTRNQPIAQQDDAMAATKLVYPYPAVFPSLGSYSHNGNYLLATVPRLTAACVAPNPTLTNIQPPAQWAHQQQMRLVLGNYPRYEYYGLDAANCCSFPGLAPPDPFTPPSYSVDNNDNSVVLQPL